jgi:hypothetical protein
MTPPPGWNRRAQRTSSGTRGRTLTCRGPTSRIFKSKATAVVPPPSANTSGAPWGSWRRAGRVGRQNVARAECHQHHPCGFLKLAKGPSWPRLPCATWPRVRRSVPLPISPARSWSRWIRHRASCRWWTEERRLPGTSAQTPSPDSAAVALVGHHWGDAPCVRPASH